MAENLNKILAEQLRDVRLPSAIGWWPPAIGWWIVASIILLGLALIAWWYLRRRRQNHYRRLALHELEACYTAWVVDHDSSAYLQSANAILKRSVLCLDDTTALVNLSGPAWISALNARVHRPLSSSTGRALAFECYQPEPTADVVQVHQQVSEWIQSHDHQPIPVEMKQHA